MIESIATITIYQSIRWIIQVFGYVRVVGLIIGCIIRVLSLLLFRVIISFVLFQFFATIFFKKGFPSTVVQTTITQTTGSTIVFFIVVTFVVVTVGRYRRSRGGVGRALNFGVIICRCSFFFLCVLYCGNCTSY